MFILALRDAFCKKKKHPISIFRENRIKITGLFTWKPTMQAFVCAFSA